VRVVNQCGLNRSALYGTQNPNGESWHNYAACRFLVNRDYSGALNGFLEALKYSPDDERIKSNFSIFMCDYHGDDPVLHTQIAIA
jgi:hypothetical protein